MDIRPSKANGAASRERGMAAQVPTLRLQGNWPLPGGDLAMKMLKTPFLALAAVCLVATHDAPARVVDVISHANASAHCQAFTPGTSNTLRNRVVGVENAGEAPVNVTCVFESINTPTSSRPYVVAMEFSVTGTSALNINCTLLTGTPGAFGAIAVNRTFRVAPGTLTQTAFSAADTPDPADVDLGSDLVGINCALPPHAMINDTFLRWSDEDGVGT